MAEDFVPDWRRLERIGITEAVYARPKSTDQLAAIIETAATEGRPLLLTRLGEAQHAALPEPVRHRLDYDRRSETAILGDPPPAQPSPVVICAAGTSDLKVAHEARRTLAFHGFEAAIVADVGVAGLWRLLERLPELAEKKVVIAVAGMEGALFTVLGGQVPGLVVAVPTSTGYGVAEGGELALRSALASCAPGISVVNIDNGYGAACIALRFLRMAG